MTDITKSTDLTSYNVDGLELFFTADRKVRASQSAIARMCSTESKVVAQAQISQYAVKLQKLGLKVDVVEHNINTGYGVKLGLLYTSDFIVACLKNYNPERLNDFMDFGINEGLAQMAGVPLPVALPSTPSMPEMTTEQQLMFMAENSLKWAKLQLAAANNPGDKRQMQMVLDADQKVLEGHGSIFDMAEANGIQMTAEQSRAVGIIMAGIVKGRKEVSSLPKTRRKTKSTEGKWQVYEVNSYPLTMTNSFLSAYHAVASV